jgi:hypothetical protein
MGRLLPRVAGENGRIVEVPLTQANTLAVFEINGWDEE